ncbi:hypothetical protein KA005_19955, partial [bacterium]|nr:hypothetical protein [bacterium]
MDSAYVAMFFDPDLGNANDDYTGCDTTLKMCYVFNGDEYDEKYGVSVPAMGCDLLQGPVVDAPDETAELPDGTILQDRKILGMTAYFVFLSGSPIAGWKEPHTPEGGYYFARGFMGNGEPWLDPTKGYEPTPFPLYGDPITGTGWLLSHLSAPKDVRMGVSSGPFSMDVGESQEFIIALVVGRGRDRYNSIDVMRYYDLAAQHMYDSNFSDVTMAPVTAQVAELDEKLMLTWDNEIVDFSKAGYNFEGYNIWQAETAEGPWTRITTFDKVNKIMRIRDWQYDLEVEDFFEKTVQFGRDSGLTFRFYIYKDYIYDVPLVNGRPYYFAVSGYAYNPDGIPKVMETHRSVVEAVPQRPVLDTKHNADLGDEIPTVHATGYSDGSCTVIVTDPSSITGDDYLVSFYTLTGGADSGQVAWKLTNTTLDVDLLTDQTHQGYDDAFMSVDGLQVKVAGQLLGVRDIV